MSIDRRRIAVLKRRRDYLAGLIQNWQGGDMGYTRAEHSALTWAIDILERTVDLGLTGGDAEDAGG
jgi:hypothetical protein